MTVLDLHGRVDFELSAADTQSIEFGKHLYQGISDLHEPAGSIADIRAALYEAGLVSPNPRTVAPAGLHPRALALSRALAACWAEIPPETFIYTANEAFWTGSVNSGPEIRRVAFRMFVSKLADIGRCNAYGLLAAGALVAVLGDDPDWSALEAILKLQECEPKAWSAPSAINLISGGVVHTLATPNAAWRELGRLSVTSLTRTLELATAEGRKLHWTNGIVAFPNLAALPELLSTESRRLTICSASGVDADPTVALSKCLSEGEERFAAGDVQSEWINVAKASDLIGPWLDPRRIICHSSAQRLRLGLGDFSPEVREHWVVGKNSSGRVWLPAALVFYPYGDLPRWLHPATVSSNGMATYPNGVGARSRAWLELVERDAFQRARILGRASGARLISGLADARLSQIADANVSIALLLPSQTGIHVILVRIDDHNSMALGMAASGDPIEALEKAIAEALVVHIHPFTHSVLASEVDTPGDHAALYRNSEVRSSLDWMFEMPRVVLSELGEPEDILLPDTAHWFKFPNPYSDRTTVRVLDPALIPLTFGYDTEPTGRADFAALLSRSGYSFDHPLLPHPFA